MYHFFDKIENKAGNGLSGYFARVIDRSTQSTVTLSSDENGTPIVVVSGVENMAKTDELGNISLYVDPGTYHLDIYAPNTTSFLFRISDVSMNATKGDTGEQGEQGPIGPNVNDIGTFAQAKALDIAGTLPSINTIRLTDRNKATFEKDTGEFGTLDTAYAAGKDIWWFKDSGGSNWIMAGRQIDIMAAGALNSKIADNGAIIQACLNFGSISKRNVFVPAGTFGYARTLLIVGATGLVGIPGVSILYCTTRNTGAIIMQGSGGTLYGITRLHYLPRPIGANDRSADDAAAGFYLRGATHFTVQFCRAEGPQASGMMVRGCQYGRITNNWFESTLADSLHVTAAAATDAPVYNLDGSFLEMNRVPIPSYRLHIADNVVNNSGDDNIGLISYASHANVQPVTEAPIVYPGYYTYYTESGGIRINQANNQSINVIGNSTYGGDARGITSVGGQNISITGNYIDDPVLAGILAYGEDEYDTYGCNNINISGNVLVNTGNDSTYKPIRYDAYGNQMLDRFGVTGLTRNLDSRSNASIIVGGRAAFPSQNIAIRSNMLTGMRQRGITIGANVTNVDITGNSLRDSLGVTVYVDAGSNITIEGNRISNAIDGAIAVNIFNCSGNINVSGNKLHNINTGGSVGTDAIHFTGPPATGVITTTISDNRISGPQTYERFIEAFFDNVVAENNFGSADISFGSVPNTVKQRVKADSDADSGATASNASNAGAPATALTQTVTQSDFNALVGSFNAFVGQHNTLLADHNDLLAKLRAAGLIGQ